MNDTVLMLGIFSRNTTWTNIEACLYINNMTPSNINGATLSFPDDAVLYLEDSKWNRIGAKGFIEWNNGLKQNSIISQQEIIEIK